MSNDNVEHQEHEHASVKTYWIVIAILAIITLIEVAIPEIAEPFKAEPGYNRMLWFWSLYGLSIVKFVMVCAFFMHLKYDSKWLTYIFSSGLIIAVGTFIALMALSPSEPPNQRYVRLKAEGKLPEQKVAADAEPEQVGEPNPQNGPAIFISKGCTACHTISSIPEAVGTTGPKLDGLGKTAATRVSGMNAEAYIQQSIEDPYAYVVDGYMKVMPNMRGAMTGQEFVDLVAYLKGL